MFWGIARLLALMTCAGGFIYFFIDMQNIATTWAQPVSDVLGTPGVIAIPFLWVLVTGAIFLWIDTKHREHRLLNDADIFRAADTRESDGILTVAIRRITAMFGIDLMTWVMIAVVLAIVIYGVFELYVLPWVFNRYVRVEDGHGSGRGIASAND